MRQLNLSKRRCVCRFSKDGRGIHRHCARVSFWPYFPYFYHPHTFSLYYVFIVAARQRHRERREGRVGVGGCWLSSSWQPFPPCSPFLLFLFSVATLLFPPFAPLFVYHSLAQTQNLVPPLLLPLPTLSTISPPTPRYHFLFLYSLTTNSLLIVSINFPLLLECQFDCRVQFLTNSFPNFLAWTLLHKPFHRVLWRTIRI